MERYGANLVEEDLGEANTRAGLVFRGHLQQNFVVLHNKRIGDNTGGSSSSEMAARTQKRPIMSRGQRSDGHTAEKKTINQYC